MTASWTTSGATARRRATRARLPVASVRYSDSSAKATGRTAGVATAAPVPGRHATRRPSQERITNAGTAMPAYPPAVSAAAGRLPGALARVQAGRDPLAEGEFREPVLQAHLVPRDDGDEGLGV